MIQWTLHYHPEAVKYLVGLRESGSAIRQVLRDLSKDPRIEEATAVEGWPNMYDLIDAEHRIRYMILKEDRIIRIILVELIPIIKTE